MNLKQKVAYILENYPETRSNDARLVSKFWIYYYPQKFFVNNSNNISIRLTDLEDLPQASQIERNRRLLRNVYPANPDVEEKRKNLQKEYRKEYGQPTEKLFNFL